MDSAFPPGAVILVDSSALVYLIEDPEGSLRREAVAGFLERAKDEGLCLAASTAAWAELLEAPFAAGDQALAARYRVLLSDSSRIALRELDVAVAERAALIAASLKGPRRRGVSSYDFLHIATAIELGAAAVLTNDGAWASVPGCPPLILVDELVAEGRAEE
jgi:predicted nucleic acid-binding protein